MSELENQVSEETLAEPQVAEASEPQNQEVNFDSIFDLPKTGFETENQEVTSESEPQQNVAQEPTQEEKSYKYWQSEADKRQSELNKVMESLGVQNSEDLAGEVQRLKTLAPVSEHIMNNPNILNSVEQNLSNGQAVGNPQENQVQPLKKPEMPIKPRDYDADDAIADSTSESYKYRISMDEYRDNMMKYQDARFEAMQMQQAEQQQLLQQEQQLAQVKGQLTGQYQMSDSDAETFIKTMSDPNSITMDNLVQLFKMQNQTQDVQPSTQPSNAPNVDEKMQEMMNERQRLATPSPVTAAKGESNVSTSSDEDNIIESMIGNYKKQNPWT